MLNISERNFLKEKLGNVPFETDYPLKNFSRYKTGGIGKIAVFPTTIDELIYSVDILEKEYPVFVIGGGSNLLISDNGFNGAVISTLKLDKISLTGNLLTAECGAKLIDLLNESVMNSLGGLEFSVGIPATVGGAVCMNAGCYNKCIGDTVRFVVSNKGTYSKEECLFDYRTSRFKNGEVILKVCFSLTPSEEDVIEEKIKTYKGFRRTPKGRNCGSVFKNDGYFAGKVIDDIGFKGFKLGGAKISDSHANYIIAEEGATSSDIYNLIQTIKDKVFKEKQIQLKEEIIYLGEF